MDGHETGSAGADLFPPIIAMATTSTRTPSSRRAKPRAAAGARSSRRSSSASSSSASSSSAKDDALIRDDEVNHLVDEGKALAEQVVGRNRFAALAGVAPTVLRIAGRYARREPVKAAGLAVLAGGIFLVARAAMNSTSESASPGGAQSARVA